MIRIPRLAPGATMRCDRTGGRKSLDRLGTVSSFIVDRDKPVYGQRLLGAGRRTKVGRIAGTSGEEEWL